MIKTLTRAALRSCALSPAVTLSFMLVGASGVPARADEPAAAPTDLWSGDTLGGDLGGLRPALSDFGVQLGFTYTNEVLANVTGGVKRGAIYEGRLEMDLDADLEKAAGLTGGSFHASAYQIHGHGLSGSYLHNLMVASTIEATPATRLFTLWYQQALPGDAGSLRIGQLAADDEFLISLYAPIFVNSTFGWPGITAQDLPSGGPAYPLATPGARLKLTPAEGLTIMGAVFNGDPAGPGVGDPQRRDAAGTTFRLRGDPFGIAEVGYAVNQDKDAPGLPGSYKLGGWYHGGFFQDQRFDGGGRALSDPRSTGNAAQRRGNYGLYAVIDQMLWRRPGSVDQGLATFLRLSGSPGDRNLVSFYADGGITYKGLIDGRDDDVAGIGVGYTRISDRASDADRDARLFGTPGQPIRDAEALIELTYQAQIAPWWSVQPDLQVIFHPGGNVPNPGSASLTPVKDAVVVGLRSTVKF